VNPVPQEPLARRGRRACQEKKEKPARLASRASAVFADLRVKWGRKVSLVRRAIKVIPARQVRLALRGLLETWGQKVRKAFPESRVKKAIQVQKGQRALPALPVKMVRRGHRAKQALRVWTAHLHIRYGLTLEIRERKKTI
jgi:hypothetical protein